VDPAMAPGIFTQKDYAAMPDEWRGELIGGELVMAPPPVPYHQHLLGELFHRLRDQLGPDQAWRVLVSPVNVAVDDRNVYQPDLLVLPADSPRPAPDWELPLPLWVVEVLSPATARYDETVKLPRLGRAGVREASIVAPRAREGEVFDLAAGTRTVHGAGGVARSLTLPGFALALDGYFAPSAR